MTFNQIDPPDRLTKLEQKMDKILDFFKFDMPQNHLKIMDELTELSKKDDFYDIESSLDNIKIDIENIRDSISSL